MHGLSSSARCAGRRCDPSAVRAPIPLRVPRGARERGHGHAQPISAQLLPPPYTHITVPVAAHVHPAGNLRAPRDRTFDDTPALLREPALQPLSRRTRQACPRADPRLPRSDVHDPHLCALQGRGRGVHHGEHARLRAQHGPPRGRAARDDAGLGALPGVRAARRAQRRVPAHDVPVRDRVLLLLRQALQRLRVP